MKLIACFFDCKALLLKKTFRKYRFCFWKNLAGLPVIFPVDFGGSLSAGISSKYAPQLKA